MDIQRGYIRLFRAIEDWEWYDNPFVTKIFIHCLVKANEKQKQWRDLTIKRGQFVTSYEKLAAANGITIQQTRTALKSLQSTNDIEYQSTNQYTVITVKKYNLWQAINIRKNEADAIPDNKQKGEQVTTTNNNIYNTKEYIYLSSSIEKNSKNKISDDERQILKNYVKRNKLAKTNLRGYVRKIIDNGDYLDILKEEKERFEKLERQKAKEVIPPPENFEKSTPEEDEAGLELLRETAKKIRKRG